MSLWKFIENKLAEDWPTSNILFEKFGRAVAKDLLE